MLMARSHTNCFALLLVGGAFVGCAAQAYDPAASGAVPEEVVAFLRERELCDHFRNEPIEGVGKEADGRRAFVLESLDIYCSGTDKRLAALKRRFAYHPDVMLALKEIEESVEAPCP
jgi:hypothetical protein